MDGIKPVHPFPARMAPSIVVDEIRSLHKGAVIFDPMAGSGTTLVHAKAAGFSAIGCDTDPLAVMIASAWCSESKPRRLITVALDVLSQARRIANATPLSQCYPMGADEETKRFVRYWFAPRARRELHGLAYAISSIQSTAIKSMLWCAFSRLIIVKQGGASLAMDVSHSRPHKAYTTSQISPFEKFEHSLKAVIRNGPFIINNAQQKTTNYGAVKIHRADARRVPVSSASVDMVLTSPPYLNAIDYLRGHRLSLVWMGHSLAELRALRSSNVGSEVTLADDRSKSWIFEVMAQACSGGAPPGRFAGILAKYVSDMEKVVGEINRVLKPKGHAVFVVGDCNVRQTFVRNSQVVKLLAARHGLRLFSQEDRALPDNRRYLPPPKSTSMDLGKRMRHEVVLKFNKAPNT